MSNLLRSLGLIFKPPFNGLALLVVMYFAWAHMVYPHNDIMRGDLPDTDDYMYLAQVLDWMKGQGWYDNIQHRLDPSLGTPIHFSRLVQIPLAIGVLFFQQFGLSPRGAAIFTALVEPLILLGFGLSVFRRVAASLVPDRWAGASAYVALFCVGLLFEFMPGHVDHHGLVIVLTMATIGCVLRQMDDPDDLKAVIGAGALLAVTTMIALEVLPWLLLLSAWLGVWAMAQGGKPARNGAVFAATLVVGNILCLVLTRPPSTLLEIDILTYSIVYIILAIAIAIPFAGVALTAKAKPSLRWTTGIVLAVVCAELFLRRFPELATGPYGGIDPQLLPLLLDEVEEAKPILRTSHGGAHIFDLLGIAILAWPVSLWLVGTSRGLQRWKAGLIALALGAALALTIFYQYRFLGITCALAVCPLTVLLYRGWGWIGSHLQGREKVFAEIGLLLLIGPLPAVLLPSLFDSRSFNTGMLLFPVDSAHTPCDMAQLMPVLRDPHGLGAQPHLIASAMELGPELLFRTDNQVLAAPFHMNVQGNLDAARFLSTPYPAEAENIARRRGVDLVVMCRSVPGHYLGPKDAAPSMAARLFKGPIPSWLERVEAPHLDNYVIYKVRDVAPTN